MMTEHTKLRGETPTATPAEARDVAPVPPLSPLPMGVVAPPAAMPEVAHLGRPGRKAWLVIVLLAVLGAGAGGGWYWWAQQQLVLPPGFASGNGRIEAEQVDIATKIPGRVAAVLVNEGAMVQAGEVLARMDTREAEATLRRSQAQVGQAQRILEARAAALTQQQSVLRLADAELERTRALVQNGFATRQALDQRVNVRESAAAGLALARAQIGEAEQAIEAAREEVARQQAALADSVLTSPVAGRVQYRLANAGEVLPAGGRVLTVLDVTDVSMAIFLPTAEAGRVALGAEGRIVLDALPDVVIPASVSFVSPQAQFTPKTVETRTERERLMFRVKLQIDRDLLRRHAEQVRTGLPGNGYVRLDRAIAWPAWLQPTTSTGS